MCLGIDPSICPPTDKEETFYKVVFLTTDGRLLSPYKGLYQYYVGTNKADKVIVLNNIVQNSIHVFLNKKDAINRVQDMNWFNMYGYSYAPIVIQVQANYKHLSGMNDYEAAFSEVTLSQEEYVKALNYKSWRFVSC